MTLWSNIFSQSVNSQGIFKKYKLETPKSAPHLRLTSLIGSLRCFENFDSYEDFVSCNGEHEKNSEQKSKTFPEVQRRGHHNFFLVFLSGSLIDYPQGVITKVFGMYFSEKL